MRNLLKSSYKIHSIVHILKIESHRKEVEIHSLILKIRSLVSQSKYRSFQCLLLLRENISICKEFIKFNFIFYKNMTQKFYLNYILL